MRLLPSFFASLAIAAHGQGAESARPEVAAWHEETGCRWAPLSVPEGGKAGFAQLPAAVTGIAFTNTLDELESAGNRVLANGAGVAVGDYDGDGRPDIFFCGLSSPNALYRNLGGWKFKDVTAEAGLTFSGKNFRGAVFADVNGDGRPDLLVSTLSEGVLCFLNLGGGRFTNATIAAGTASASGSATMALADVDGDGTLDLYITSNRREDIRDRGQVDLRMVRGQLVVPPAFQDRLLMLNGKLEEYGEPDRLLFNDGTGRFTSASWTNGIFLDEGGAPLSAPPRDWGLTAAFHDLNGDGAPDLYVCNDYWTPDRFWLNDGHGHFRAVARQAVRHTSASSMGVDFADLTREGKTDILVVDMLSRDPRLRKRQLPAQTPMGAAPGGLEDRLQFMRNTLLHPRGDGSYEEIADFAGVAASEWSWQPTFLDVDLDGYEDLLISAGYPQDVQDMDAEGRIRARQHSWAGYPDPVARQKAFTEERMANLRLYPRFDSPIVAFRNLGNLQFKDVTADWGTTAPGVHNGMALGDFDGDGDLDFVVNNLGAGAGVYRNETSAPRVSIRLRGRAPNTAGIGGRVALRGGATALQSQEIAAGGRYLSGSQPILTFAAGQAKGGMQIEVSWRSGKTSLVRDVGPNRLYEIDEPEVSPSSAKKAEPPARPLFQDVSNRLQHRDLAEPFNDFERQPLLPRRLSQAGPGVAWFDLDGDGHDDLLIGSGRGGALAVYRGDGRGGFERLMTPLFSTPAARDQTTVLGFRKGPGKASVLVGSANYKDGLAIGGSMLDYDLSLQAVLNLLAGATNSTGPLALADFDGTHHLALFVGGRVLPGRYPESTGSRLYRFDGAQWRFDPVNSRALENTGMVSGAVWSDLDGDGFPELILACEWGPVRVFKNQRGALREVTREMGLEAFTGWWNSVAVGDFDGDGAPDIVAGNWGLNSPYAASPEHPQMLYYADLAGRGVNDLVEAGYEPRAEVVLARRTLQALGPSLPFLSERFPTFKAYSEASLSDMLGDQLPKFKNVQATTLASMLFMNRNGRFEGRPLPREAQMTPAFGLVVADFDGDGREDLFLSQNFFATQPEIPRLDSGRGLLLLGDGRGGLTPVPAVSSGIEVYGEQRGAAAADFNEDGRVDLVVTQVGAATRLLENVTARPGLRVRLQGPGGNLEAIGAVLRLRFAGGWGPARELHAGAGYWSQDGSVQVLATPEPPTEIQVRWPGGRETTTAIPAGSLEVVVDASGALVRAQPR